MHPRRQLDDIMGLLVLPSTPSQPILEVLLQLLEETPQLFENLGKPCKIS